jgi:2-methylcitrate dehydratase PrpD
MASANPSADTTLSERLARYVHSASGADLDPSVLRQVKRILVYHVGLALRAVRAREPDSEQAARVALELSDGGGASRLIGRSARTTLVDAVLANCTAMRAGGLDDVIFPAGIHPGLVTLPVALGVAERQRAGGRAFMNAVVVAYEILGKFGQWTWALESPRRPTMLFGPFGSIVAAAKLLQLDAEQLARAFGYAVHMAMGVAESDAGPITHFYSLLCRNGVTGAYLARAGGWASPTAIEGRFGFLDSFFGGSALDAARLLESLGRDFVVFDSCEKPYPGTALNHVPIELMRQIVQRHQVSAEDLETLLIEVPLERRNFEVGHLTGPFKTRSAAVSSCAFQLAAVLLDGCTNQSRYDDFANPRIQALVDRMRFQFVTGKPIRYARLQLCTQSGQTYVEEGETLRYPPESARDIMQREASGILPREKVERFLELLEHLEDVADMGEVMECLTP